MRFLSENGPDSKTTIDASEYFSDAGLSPGQAKLDLDYALLAYPGMILEIDNESYQLFEIIPVPSTDVVTILGGDSNSNPKFSDS